MMKLLSPLLFIMFESLFVNYASSRCQSLNGTVFDACFKVGFNVSEFSTNTSQREIYDLTASTLQTFNTCSSFSALMSCSVHVPKCSTVTLGKSLPSKLKCRNFVRDCQNASAETEGLMTLFRGLCELLPSEPRLPMSNGSYNVEDNVTCQRLNISQCTNAGYNFTSVSRAYQKMVESSGILQRSRMNSTITKLICMELAPPCERNADNLTFVPCKSTCQAAYNESESQFTDSFKNQSYCSTFPDDKNQSGKEYCTLDAWPEFGYWPSGLWKSIRSTEPNLNSTTPPTTASSKNSSVPVQRDNKTVSTTKPFPGSTPLPTTTTLMPTSVQSIKSSMHAETTTVFGKVNTPVPTTNTSKISSTPMPTTVQSEKNSVQVETTTAPGKTNTPLPTTNTSEISSTSVPTTVQSEKRSLQVETTTASGKSNTPVATTNTSEMSSTSMPTTMQSEKSSVQVETATASGKSNTPVATTNTSEMSSAPMPTTQQSEKSSVQVETAKASRIRSTSVPTTTASGKSSAIMPTTNPSRTDGTNGAPGIQAKSSNKLSVGAITGLVVGLLIGLAAIVVGVVCFKRYNSRRAQFRHSLMVDMDEL